MSSIGPSHPKRPQWYWDTPPARLGPRDRRLMVLFFIGIGFYLLALVLFVAHSMQHYMFPDDWSRARRHEYWDRP